MARERRARLVAGVVLLWVQADVHSLRPTLGNLKNIKQ